MDSRTDPWQTATWEGARREELRRWAALPLEKILAAQEEMHAVARMLGLSAEDTVASGNQAVVGEASSEYET